MGTNAIDSSKFQGEMLDDLQIGRFQDGTLGRLQAGSSEGGTGAGLAIPPRRRKVRQGARQEALEAARVMGRKK